MKQVIHSLFGRLGYRIVKQEKNNSNTNNNMAQGLLVQDPILHNSLSKIEEFYGNTETLNNYLDEHRLEFYNEILKKIDFDNFHDNNSLRICDVGCGPGMLIKLLSEKMPGNSYFGLEYSKNAVDYAKRLVPLAQFEVFDIYELNEKLKFDFIFCTEVLEHLETPEVALFNLFSMVDEGGTLFLSVPDGRRDTFLGHINFWSPESWRNFINSNINSAKSIDFQYLERAHFSHNLCMITK